jgi:hypothetical protein
MKLALECGALPLVLVAATSGIELGPSYSGLPIMLFFLVGHGVVFAA